MDILARIKRLVRDDYIFFTNKAKSEMYADDLTRDLVCEAIKNASTIAKTLRSKNPRTGNVEKLYVIKGITNEDLTIYTKGKIDKFENHEVLYVFISSKRSTD